MFDDFRRERQVRQALRAIARQRVVSVLQPGNVIVVERSPPKEEWFEIGIRTAEIRGWVEVLHENLPTGTLQMKGDTPELPSVTTPETHYKLTEGGWAVLNSSHQWVIATFFVSTVGLVISVGSFVIGWLSMPKP